MAGRKRYGIARLGWLLVVIGVFAAGVGLLVWLVRLATGHGGSDADRVWVTPGGTHYHRRQCRALARSEPSSATLDEAIADGLMPCDLCEPPV